MLIDIKSCISIAQLGHKTDILFDDELITFEEISLNLYKVVCYDLFFFC